MCDHDVYLTGCVLAPACREAAECPWKQDKNSCSALLHSFSFTSAKGQNFPVGISGRADWSRSWKACVAEALCCDCPRCSRHSWNRLSQWKVFQGLKESRNRRRWAFGVVVAETEISQLAALAVDLAVVGLLRNKTCPLLLNRWKHNRNQDSVLPIQKLICQLESQGWLARLAQPVTALFGQYRSQMYMGWMKSHCYCIPFCWTWQKSEAAKWLCHNCCLQCIFWKPSGSRVQTTVCFHLEGVLYTWNQLPHGEETQPLLEAQNGGTAQK